MYKKVAIMTLLLPWIWARSQPFPPLHFSQLTERDGLSCDRASAVTQDEDGVIWIGTANGLNRFDGYGCTRFFANSDDSSTLPGNVIEKVVAGKNNELWLLTIGGLCRFNTTTHKVKRFRSGNATPPVFRIFDGAGIWIDERGEAFITSSTGLYHFDNPAQYTTTDELLQDIVRDKSGGLWSFRQNMIYQLDDSTKKIVRTFTVNKNIFINGLLFDHHNRCWVSTWSSGILRFEAANGTVSKLPGQGVNDVVIGTGVEWRLNGRYFLVFSSNAPGLLLVDEETGKSELLLHDFGIEAPEPIYVDRQNILWVPTSKGVLYVNSVGSLFTLMPVTLSTPDPTARSNPDPIDQTTPYVMREETSGYWIGRRYHGGMLWYDRDWHLQHCWKDVTGPIPPELQKDTGLTKEAFDFKQLGGEMFITTELGVLIMNLKTLTRTLIRYPAGNPIMRLRTIVPRDDGNWWIRSFDQGVFVFDPVGRRFIRHYPLRGDCRSCAFPQATYLYRDHRGNIFVTTNEGLFQYDRKTDGFVHLNPGGRPAVGNSMLGMTEDASGLLWIGLDYGICAYNPDSGKVVRTLSENNTIGPVYRLTVDSNQNVWFSSPAGYWCWLRRQDRTILFGSGQELPDNNEGLFYTTANGNVYAGCLGALVRFHADRIMDYSVEGKVKIMDILVNGGEMVTAPDEGQKMPLVLGPGQNNLQIGFDVINYDIPANNLFFYKLTPGSGNWVQVDNGKLSFNNLPAGEYELKVKGGNKLTGIFTPTDSLTFVIRPFWWLSSWFKAVVALALLLLLTVLVRLRIRHIRLESAFRQKIADTEMRALRAQMNPHFVFNSLSSIENFIMKNEQRLASDYLGKFARLIRMILSSSLNELVPFSNDMEALALYVDLELLRFNHKFAYSTTVDPEVSREDFRLPSLLIQPYVENAIIHGIGLSTAKGLYVHVRVFMERGYIHYVIRDNGVGRKQAAEINQRNRPNHKSVGLTITQDRIHIFSHQQQSEGSVRITDLYDVNGAAAGTEVEVIIKAV
jgi:ligand-binding sensor domain-containing protein